MPPILTRLFASLCVLFVCAERCPAQPLDPIGSHYSAPLVLLEAGAPGETQPVLFRTVDVNVDGRQDVVFAGPPVVGGETQWEDPMVVSIWVANEAGILEDATTSLLGGGAVAGYFEQIIAAHFNGDFKPDLFLEDRGPKPDCGDGTELCWPGGQNRLFLSQTDGSLLEVTASNLPALSDFTRGSAAGDFDGDGDIDLWINNLTGTIFLDPQVRHPRFSYLMFNDGAGVFSIVADFGGLAPDAIVGTNGRLPDDTRLWGSWATAVDSRALGARDLSLGQALQFANCASVSCEFYRNENALLLNDGSGVFSLAPMEALPESEFGESGTRHSRAFDIDQDGLEDLLLHHDPGQIQALLSNGDGSFRDETASRMPNSPADRREPFQLHDVDGDGYLDVINSVNLVWEGQTYPEIRINDGEGYFREIDQHWIDPDWNWQALDADGDGGTDLLSHGPHGLLLHKMTTPYGPAINGDDQENRLAGGALAEALLGFEGNDWLDGGLGDDRLYGGPGNDQLQGGKGNDVYVYLNTDLSTSDDIIEMDGEDRLRFIGFGLDEVPSASRAEDGSLTIDFQAGGGITVHGHFGNPQSQVEWLEAGGCIYQINRDPGFSGGSIEELLGDCMVFVSSFEDGALAKPVPSRLQAVSGNGQIALPLTNVDQPLTVQVVGVLGDPIANHEVQFTVMAGDGTFTELDDTTGQDGIAQAHWKLGPVWGDHRVEVTADGLPETVEFNASTDILGVTTFQIEQALAGDPLHDSTAPPIDGTDNSLRDLALLAMHEIELAVLNFPGPDIEAYYYRSMDRVAAEFQQPVTEGVRIWKMYNHGFLAKDASGAFAFDLMDGPPDWGPMWSYELPASIINDLDILFISHEHADHWTERVASAVLANGGDVVYPDVLGPQFDLSMYGNVPMSGGDSLMLGAYQVNAYYGVHSAPNRLFEVTTPAGIRVMHTGDTGESQWVPLADGDPIDVLLINIWMNENDANAYSTEGLTNAVVRAEPELMMPAHTMRFAGMDTQRLTLWNYPSAMAVTPALPPDVLTEIRIPLWGERYDYVPGMPVTLTITTTWLAQGETSSPYASQLAARGSDGTYSWSVVEGELPAGLGLAANGELSGTPTEVGIWEFTVEALGGDGQIDRQTLTMEVTDPLPVLLPTEYCSDYEEAIATFEDPDLDALVRTATGISDTDLLTCSLLTGPTLLQASVHTINSLWGIQNMPNLSDIRMNSNDISDLDPLAGLTQLVRIYLESNLISDISPLSGLTNLFDLRLTDNTIGDISPLAALPSVVYMYLGRNSISDISSLSGIGLPNLKYLQLNENAITSIDALGTITSMDFLSLNDNTISDISALSSLTNMRVLILNDNLVSDLSPLSGLTNLTIQLYLNNNQISDISALSAITQIKYLELRDNMITDISALVGPHPELLVLRLDNNPGLSNIQSLIDNTGLDGGETVWLVDTSVSCADVALLEAKGVIVNHNCVP